MKKIIIVFILGWGMSSCSSKNSEEMDSLKSETLRLVSLIESCKYSAAIYTDSMDVCTESIEMIEDSLLSEIELSYDEMSSMKIRRIDFMLKRDSLSKKGRIVFNSTVKYHDTLDVVIEQMRELEDDGKSFGI